MITEYKVHLENKTKDELVAFILQLQKQIDEKDKRIKELEEENVILRKANNITRDLIKEVKIEDITQVINKSYEEFVNQFVAKQKIKDKIEKEIKYHERNILDIENITMLKSKTAKEEAEIEFNKYAIVVLKKMLQELLEGRK